MTRREFLLGSAGLLLALKAGLSGRLSDMLVPEAKTAVGPLVIEGLRFVPDAGDTCRVYFNNDFVLESNDLGGQALSLADGFHTLADITDHFAKKLTLDHEEKQSFFGQLALFFVEVGKAGYLQNQVYASVIAHEG